MSKMQSRRGPEVDPGDFVAGADVSARFLVAKEIGIVLSVEFTKAEAEALFDAADHEGDTIIEFAGKAILASIVPEPRSRSKSGATQRSSKRVAVRKLA